MRQKKRRLNRAEDIFTDLQKYDIPPLDVAPFSVIPYRGIIKAERDRRCDELFCVDAT